MKLEFEFKIMKKNPITQIFSDHGQSSKISHKTKKLKNQKKFFRNSKNIFTDPCIVELALKSNKANSLYKNVQSTYYSTHSHVFMFLCLHLRTEYSINRWKGSSESVNRQDRRVTLFLSQREIIRIDLS